LIESIFIGVAVSLASQIGLSRVSFAAVDSVFAAHVTTRNVSNFTAYFVTSFTTLIFALLLLLSEDSSGKMNKNDIQQLGRELIAFAFGISTAAIGTKINSVVYGKAAEGALSLITQL
jgi:Na+/H+-translocating membrane pyrophosphatase